MDKTLFDIFYSHNWFEFVNDQQRYGKALAEMKECAYQYAEDIMKAGDRWKSVIVREARELDGKNYYSMQLKGEKVKWHNYAVSDFLLYVIAALEHYGYNLNELPKSAWPLFGMEQKIELKKKASQETPNVACGNSIRTNDKTQAEGIKTTKRGKTTKPLQEIVVGATPEERTTTANEIKEAINGQTPTMAFARLEKYKEAGVIAEWPTWGTFCMEFKETKISQSTYNRHKSNQKTRTKKHKPYR